MNQHLWLFSLSLVVSIKSAGMILSGDERGLQNRGGVNAQQFDSAFSAFTIFLVEVRYEQ